jgi:hypothetical protein
MSSQDRLAARFGCHHAGALADMGKVDRDAQLVHQPHGIAAHGRHATIFGFQAAITQEIPTIVGQLCDP